MKILFSVFILSCVTIFSQSAELYGTAQPGNAMIGKAENVLQVMLNNKIIQVDKNGMFIFGFDRDAEGTHLLKIKYIDGKSELKKFSLPKRQYDIQKINSNKKQFSSPPEEELARIERERQLMREARKKIGIVDTAYFASGFQLPIKGRKLTGVFGSQRILNGVPQNVHNGLDFSAPKGEDVFAMADGIVRLAGDNFYYNGNFVLIDHGQGLSSVYLHFSKLSVNTGDFVIKGQKIGEVGTTGRSTGPHLHWGVNWYDKKIDPNSLLGFGL